MNPELNRLARALYRDETGTADRWIPATFVRVGTLVFRSSVMRVLDWRTAWEQLPQEEREPYYASAAAILALPAGKVAPRVVRQALSKNHQHLLADHTIRRPRL